MSKWKVASTPCMHLTDGSESSRGTTPGERPDTWVTVCLPELDYPFHDKTIHVTSCGRICLHCKKINLSTVFAGQAIEYQGSRRRYLAGQLYELRTWLLRSGGKNSAASRKPFWPKSVRGLNGSSKHSFREYTLAFSSLGSPAAEYSIF
jgi:hypothetical protein